MASVDNQIIEKFQEVLGLSINESKVYYSLLLNPDASIAELAEFSQLPRSRIYEMLAKLAAQRLVEKNPNSGYYIIPPKESISSKIEELEAQTNKRKHSLRRIEEFLDDLWHKNLVDESTIGVKLIPGHSIEPMIISDINQMNQRILIAAASANPVIDWGNTTRQLMKRQQSELDIRYLVNDPMIAKSLENSVNFHSISSNTKVKYNEELHISFIIIDSVSYLFIFGEESMLEPLVMRSVSNQLTKALSWMFEKLWS